MPIQVNINFNQTCFRSSLIAGSGTSVMLAIRSAALLPLKNENTVGQKILKAAPLCTKDIAASVPSWKYTDSCKQHA